jgi:hypothetical protein
VDALAGSTDVDGATAEVQVSDVEPGHLRCLQAGASHGAHQQPVGVQVLGVTVEEGRQALDLGGGEEAWLRPSAAYGAVSGQPHVRRRVVVDGSPAGRLGEDPAGDEVAVADRRWRKPSVAQAVDPLLHLGRGDRADAPGSEGRLPPPGLVLRVGRGPDRDVA